jgi:CAAX protease family protein
MNYALEPSSDRSWRAAHGAIFLALMVLIALSPVHGRWPWFWLIPLAAYFTLTALLPPLRRTFVWPRAGRVSPIAWAATAALIVVTSVSLVVYETIAQPDVTFLGAALPAKALGGLLLAGVIFSLLNATLEELVFRGVLFDAIESEWGWRAAVSATAVLFGIGHMNGFPPGWIGASLAGIYGVFLGMLRVQTGGLLVPIIAHIAADATIYSLLVHAGAL